MKFILNEYHRNTPEEELLEDLKKTAKELGNQKLSTHEYNAYGKFSSATIIQRFNGWNKAKEKAGLEIIKENTLNELQLFENLKKVWTTLKRQPLTKDMVRPLSLYSSASYMRRFGSWRAALLAFVKYIENEKAGSYGKKLTAKAGGQNKLLSEEKLKNKKTARVIDRNVSKSLRFDILQRDKYKCRVCGASPATNPKVILHVDHIIPHSKGGKTIPENLQTLCSECNYGKGTKTNSK